MLSVRLPQEMEQRLDSLCAKTNRPRSYFVKQALEKYLEDEEDLADAMAAYEEHLRTGGEVYTLEEMKSRYDLD